VALVIALSPAVASGQESVSASIPFRFMAAGKTHEPGEYLLRVNTDQQSWTLATAKGTSTVAVVVTRLAANGNPGSGDRLVFDKVGDTYYLSEVWPQTEDGYLLHVTKERHTHHVVKLSRPAR
jgi:hypothetical protein